MKARAGIALACAVCAACSLFVDTGEFTSGEDLPTTDGGDASAPGSDGATTSDDSGDARDAADVTDAGDPCAFPAFCDSFERDDVQGDWTSTTTSLGGTLTLDSQAFAGAKSLAITLPEVDAGSVSASLYRTIASTAKRFVWAYAIFLPPITPGRYVNVGAIRAGTPETVTFLRIRQNAAIYLTEQNENALDEYPAGTITTGAWHRIEQTIDTETNQVTLAVDGTTRFLGVYKFFRGAPSYRASAGVTFSVPGTAVQILVDEVRFTPLP